MRKIVTREESKDDHGDGEGGVVVAVMVVVVVTIAEHSKFAPGPHAPDADEGDKSS